MADPDRGTGDAYASNRKVEGMDTVKFKILIILGCCLWLGTLCEAVSLNVSEGSASQLIRFAAQTENINVVMDSSIDTKVSVNIQNMPARDAIHQIVLASGLTMMEREGTLFIGRGQGLMDQLGKVHVIPVQYADLGELKGEVELYVPKVAVDVNSRSLLIYGTREEAAKVQELVRKLDVPARQVALEARVVAVKQDAADKMGVSWEWSKIPHDFTYNAQLDLLLAQGKAKVLSKPNIVTMQGREAVINIGGEVPVPAVSVTNSTTTTSIEYRPAGIILKCRPFVNADGYIDSVLHIEVSAPTFVKEMKAYSFQKRSVDTQVRLQDGETLVIGGLISKEEEKQFAKIPFLGDIPILGQLFQNRSSRTSNEEIMIFIKAQILQ